MSDDRKLAMFIDFENIVRGVKEAQYKAFEIKLVWSGWWRRARSW